MKNYVLARHNKADNSVCYLQRADSEYFFGGVESARRFELDELLDMLKRNSCLASVGFSVVRIEDVTFELMKEDKVLAYKYSTLEYAIR